MHKIIENDSTQSQYSYWDWMPSRQKIVKTGTALATFTALAVGVIGIVSMCYSNESGHNYCFASPEEEPATTLATVALGTVAAANAAFAATKNIGVAEAAFVNKFELEEFKNCRPALMRERQSISLCQASHSNVQNQTESIQLSKDRGLASNLKLAGAILSDTLEAIHFSPNNLVRSRKIIEDRARKQGIILNDLSELADPNCLDLSRFGAQYESEGQKGSIFTLIKINAEFAKSTSIGNCGEMSAVALFKGMEKGIWNARLDYVYIPGGDHAIVVIGRDPESDPEDYRTWGSSAVVIDAWIGKIYKLSDIAEHFKDLINVDPKTGEPLLKPFDPEKQQLSVLVGNVCSKKELLDFKGHTLMYPTEARFYDRIVQQLELFHQTEDLQTKLIKAKALVALCEDEQVENFSVVSLLKDQINHFIELYSKYN